MTGVDLVVPLALLGGSILLVAVNVALQRLARPDRGTERIAGCCGMVVPAEIINRDEDLT